MKSVKAQKTTLFVLFAVSILVAEPALANRLQEAAQTGSSTVMNIARALSVIGLAIGGGMMSVGWGQMGKQVLGGAVIGIFATFGGPAFIDMIKSIFGG